MQKNNKKSIKTYIVPALERGLKILEMLSEHPSGLLMGEMKELQLPAASLYRMLVTLAELGYIIRDEHDRYHLGRKLLSVGNKESYHFKELGQAVYDGSGKICNLPETISKDIELLKRDHLHPETGK